MLLSMEVKFKLNLSVLSFNDFGKKSLTYKDIFYGLSESYDKMIRDLSDRIVMPEDDISLSFTVNL